MQVVAISEVIIVGNITSDAIPNILMQTISSRYFLCVLWTWWWPSLCRMWAQNFAHVQGRFVVVGECAEVP